MNRFLASTLALGAIVTMTQATHAAPDAANVACVGDIPRTCVNETALVTSAAPTPPKA